MLKLIQKSVVVQPDGRVSFDISELPPGTTADVLFIVPPPATASPGKAAEAEPVAAASLVGARS